MRGLFIFVLFLSATFISGVCYAGFEWLPPAQNPAPIMIEKETSVSRSVMSDTQAMAAPSVPVMSEPLGGVASMAAPQRAIQKLHTQNLSGGGLYIDPYPLQQGAEKSARLSARSVGQAMAEEARVLNPLRLGAGLKTGAQPEAAKIENLRYAPEAHQAGSGDNVAAMYADNPMSSTPSMTPAPSMATGNQDIAAFNAAFDRQYGTAPGVVAGRGTPNVMYEQAVGFGKDLPLALALSQVVPEGFTYRYAPNVDAGEIVSWQGGVPWNQVLDQMLRSKGMMADIRGNDVIIRPLARL
ncbi:MAG: STN domain-containing protein [Alphaproteobacteria bacterium]|nr:STN domain-containing protein [Alphaproteobacteria bacterium]